MTCVVEGCGNARGPGRGMCHKHYKRWQLHGHTGLTNGSGCDDPRERLAFRGRRSKAGCLEWTGHVGVRGYGQTKWMYKFYSVHRLSWILTYGAIPNGLFVCHKCDNKLCFEPTHLFLGTARDNVQDALAKGRKKSWKGSGNPKWKGGMEASRRRA